MKKFGAYKNVKKNRDNKLDNDKCYSLTFTGGPLGNKTYHLCQSGKNPVIAATNGIEHEPKELGEEELKFFNAFFSRETH